jgi:hypothetical protein
MAVGRQLTEGVYDRLFMVVVRGLQSAGEVHLHNQGLVQAVYQCSGGWSQAVDIVLSQVNSEKSVTRPHIDCGDAEHDEQHL